MLKIIHDDNWKLKLDNNSKHLVAKENMTDIQYNNVDFSKKLTKFIAITKHFIIYPLEFTAKAHSLGSFNHRHYDKIY